MTNSTTPLASALENFRKSAQDFARALKTAVREFFKTVVSWFDRHVKPIIDFMRRYEKDVARHKHNLHTRSTWRTNWDTRQRHQVTYRKPNFAVARRNC